MHVLMIFTLLSIFSKTFFFKYGLVGIVCSRFRFTFILLAVYPVVFMVERLFRAVKNFNNFLDIYSG
jgi:hypothetical protein